MALPAPPGHGAGRSQGAPAVARNPDGPISGSASASRSAYERFAEARAALLQRVSRRLLQSEAVDFRRLWTDRGIRAGPPGGLSLWRPVPPVGYAALGAQENTHTDRHM